MDTAIHVNLTQVSQIATRAVPDVPRCAAFAGTVATSVLKSVAPHFPAVAPAAKPPPALLTSLTALNLQVAFRPSLSSVIPMLHCAYALLNLSEAATYPRNLAEPMSHGTSSCRNLTSS